MRALPIILVFSVLANAALALGLLARPGKSAPVAGSPAAAAETRVVTRKVVERSQQSVVGAGSTMRQTLDWRAIESEDFKRYIANLREAGCPESTIRDIIIADINKIFANRWRTEVSPAPQNYWEPWNFNVEYSDPKLRHKKRELEVERVALIRELLGVEYDREMRGHSLNWTWLDREDNFLAFLPQEKADAARELKDRCRRLTHDVESRAPAGGKLSPADQAEYDRLRKEETAGLKALLTPAEFTEYMLCMSATATRVRSGSLGFDMRPKEFEALVYAEWHNAATPEATAREREEKVRNAMGDERFAQYQKVKDRDFQSLMRFALQQEISTAVVSQVYDLQKTSVQQMRELTALGLPPEERAAKAKAIQNETSKAISAAMGEAAYRKFQMASPYMSFR